MNYLDRTSFNSNGTSVRRRQSHRLLRLRSPDTFLSTRPNVLGRSRVHRDLHSLLCCLDGVYFFVIVTFDRRQCEEPISSARAFRLARFLLTFARPSLRIKTEFITLICMNFTESVTLICTKFAESVTLICTVLAERITHCFVFHLLHVPTIHTPPTSLSFSHSF